MEDRQIVGLFFERSENAIVELAVKYGKLCNMLANNILHNDRDAEECVNDAYLAVWNTVPPQSPDSLSAYLCRITRNLSLKRYHANTAQKRDGRYDVILEELWECVPGSGGVEEEILARELAEYMNSFLDRQKKQDRIMFVQRYWFCVSIPEIAKALGVSANYVTVHLHRTRERLKKDLKKEGFWNEEK